MRSPIILFIAFACSILTLANAENNQPLPGTLSKRIVRENMPRNTGPGSSNVRLAHAKKFKKGKYKKGLTGEILDLLGGGKNGALNL